MNNILRLVWSLYGGQVSFMLVTLLVVAVYPLKSMGSVTFLLLICQFLYYIYKKNFNARVWFKSSLSIVGFMIVLDLLYFFLGGWGTLGLVFIIVALALYRVWRGRVLYNSFTTWAADRLKGKRRDDFDFGKEKNDGEGLL